MKPLAPGGWHGSVHVHVHVHGVRPLGANHYAPNDSRKSGWLLVDFEPTRLAPCGLKLGQTDTARARKLELI